MKDDKNGLLDALDTDAGDGQTPAPSGATEAPIVEQEPKPEGKRLSTAPEAVALRQAREEAKAERRRREELEARYTRLENEYFTRQKAEQPKPQEPTDEDPEPGDDDIVGQLHWTRRQFKQFRDEVLGTRKQEAEQSQQRMMENNIIQAVGSRFVEQVQTRPELQDAYQHVRKAYAKQFALFGFPGMVGENIMPGSPLDQAMERQEKAIIFHCYQNDIPIENALMELAQSVGFQAAPILNAQVDAGDPVGMRETERPRNEKGQFVSQETWQDKAAQAKAAELANAQSANRSLSQGSGAPTKKMGAKELAQMSEEEQWAEFRKNKNNPSFDREMNFR